jgi:hypothetical protein
VRPYQIKSEQSGGVLMDGFYILGGLGLLTLIATICFVMDLLTPSEKEFVIVKKTHKPIESFSLSEEYSNDGDDVIINNFDDDIT